MAERDDTHARRQGHLLVIGGDEDVRDDKPILQRFVELSGGVRSTLAVLTSASEVPDKEWKLYDTAFGALGVKHRVHLDIRSREQAGDRAATECLAEAGGIFISGGDQKRLLALIGGTLLADRLRRAFEENGACIAGTSAGASALSGLMLAGGQPGVQPEKGASSLGDGLGFLPGVIIDQHFSERQRLPRLLELIARNPSMHGVGIDEDTALVISPGQRIEVIGQGAVTVIDPRFMLSNMDEVPDGSCPELVDVRLHLLPSGTNYAVSDPNTSGMERHPLEDFLIQLTKRTSKS